MEFYENAKQSLKTRKMLLAVGTIGLVFAGIMYAWSILKSPFESEFGWTNSSLSTIYTIACCFFCAGLIIGGQLIKKISPRVLVVVGGIVMGIGFCLISTINEGGYIGLLIYFGILGAFGIGVSYNTILGTVNPWFPDKKGFCSGVLMMGFGASTLVLGNICSVLFGVESFGWRKVFLALGICSAVILVIVGLLLRKPGENADLPKPSAPKQAKPEDEIFENRNTPQMLTRLSFWKFFIAFTLLGAAGASIISFARDFSLSVGTPAAWAGIFVGVFAVSNGLGRIISGIIFDKLGRRILMIYISAMEIAACAVCAIAVLLSSVIICLIGLILMGLCYGSSSNGISTFITAFYGTKFYAQNFPFGMVTMIPGAFLAKLSTTILNATGTYAWAFVLMIGYGIIAAILNITNRRP